MKILITGATGFIGSHLADRLIKDKHEIVCMVRQNSNTNYLKKLPVTLCTDIPVNINTYDLIYYVAGQLGNNKSSLYDYKQVHIILPYKILCKLNNSQRFIYMSSNYVNYIKKPYEQTKLDGERIIEQSLNTNYTIIRPGFVYGPRDYHHLKLFKLINKSKLIFPVIGQGNNIIAPTYIKDVVNALIFAMNTQDKIIPVAGKHITMLGFIDTISKTLGKKLTYVHLPIIKIKPFKDWLKVDFFTQQTPFESYKEPTSLELGLIETIDWYRKKELI